MKKSKLQNEKVYIAFDIQPLSYNSKNKTNYEKKLQLIFTSQYSHLYSFLPFSDSIESRIALYHREQNFKNVVDIDNISKPIIDSFVGLIYSDDKQVIQRVAMRYDLQPMEMIAIDCTEMPYAVEQDVTSFMSNKSNHLVVCSFRRISRSDIMGA